MTTGVATLAGWVPPVDLNKVSSVPLGLVSQHRRDLMPPYVAYGFCQRAVLHLQAFRSYDLVLVNELRGQFVREVSALVGNPGIFSPPLSFFFQRISAVVSCRCFWFCCLGLRVRGAVVILSTGSIVGYFGAKLMLSMMHGRMLPGLRAVR